MSVTTISAAQNTYPSNITGGTRNPAFVDIDIAPFVDAIEDQETHFLNSLKKGRTVNQRLVKWGMKGVNPRGSTIGTAPGAGTETTTTSITLPTGHGARFQQGHVLLVRQAAGGREIVWVADDPAQNVLTVKRAQGGTTAVSLAVGDTLTIIGIAMPQLSDFPIAPVSRGRHWFNYCQEFSKHITMSSQNRYTPDFENPSGDWLAEDMLQLGKDIRLDLNNACLFGRRQAGNPDQADLDPPLMGGLEQFAEQSGNVYNLAGAALTVESLDTAFVDLHQAVGRNAGKLLLMSLPTKQIFNRLLHPFKYQSGVGVKANSADLTWDSVKLETGTYSFNHMLDIPDGVIWIYDNSHLDYSPFVNLDWKEKEVPTKGNYVWKGISGTYTMHADRIPGMAVIKNFDTTLSTYPKWGPPA